MRKSFAIIVSLLLGTGLAANAQSEIYPGHFDLEEVTLLDGPFKKAMNLNIDVLMQYDTNRLLTPFVRQAGLSEQKKGKYAGWTERYPSFKNWGLSNWTLEGHVGGHYMSALALAYAACHDEQRKAELIQRLDYIIDVLTDCQNAYSKNKEGMRGFIGGQPINDAWKGLYKGDLAPFQKVGGWVPFYCQHKVLAGLRDVYLYADGKTAQRAKKLYKGLCDWSVNVISNLDDNTVEGILGWEHGGMNETLADAYRIFKNEDKKAAESYLKAAKLFSHKQMIKGMQTADPKFLNRKHANTQVPKYIGFERVFQEDASAVEYGRAAENFWTDVAEHRTVCIGGNSVNEHFLEQDGSVYVNEPDGPESCNTNNMLKLSEDLFDRTHDAKYADFYEAAMWNHILSTQDPETGGYVYFTPLRPQCYKVYSKPNNGMWCCVGTGMENHSKYGHFIYTHSVNAQGADTLFVNLFTASELSSDKFGIRQETNFPYEQKTKLTVTKPGRFVLAVRKPSWTDGMPASYTYYTKSEWKAGDVVNVSLPMQLTYEECPNLSDYIAFKYGPILLGARTTKTTADAADTNGLKYEQLANEYAGEGRMDHSEKVMTRQLSLASAPMLIGPRAYVLNRVHANADSPKTLQFTIDASLPGVANYEWNKLTLQPYYTIHHSRLMNYWYQQTAEGLKNSSWAKAEAVKAALEARTIDFVATGEQQSEAGHDYNYSADSNKGSHRGEYYRDAQKGGYVEYTLFNKSGAATDLTLVVRLSCDDNGRKCSVTADGVSLGELEVTRSKQADDNRFYNAEIKLPKSVVTDAQGAAKKAVKIRFSADKGTVLPGLYYVRLAK